MNYINKKLTILVFLSAFYILYSNSCYSSIPSDKQKHLAVSTFIGAGLQSTYNSNILRNLTLCTSVGVGKEMYDKLDYGLFDTKDLAYDFAGCLFGIYGIYGISLLHKEHENKIIFKYKF